MFKKITKAEAKKVFASGGVVYFCPCKMRPDGPFSQACPIYPEEWIERAEIHEKYKPEPFWKGTVVKTAWELVYNSWSYHNTSWEAGYYPAYYVAI